MLDYAFYMHSFRSPRLFFYSSNYIRERRVVHGMESIWRLKNEVLYSEQGEINSSLWSTNSKPPPRV